MYEIIFYKNKKGKSEIHDYLLDLQKRNDKNSRVNLEKIDACIRVLKKHGTNIGAPYIKYLRDDIWELRPVRNRILFAYFKDNKFILLNIFIKQTQKTPKREIEKAKRYLEEFMKRSDNDE